MINVHNRVIVWRADRFYNPFLEKNKRVRKRKVKKKKKKKISIHNLNWESREKNQSFIEVSYSCLLWSLLLIQMETCRPGFRGKNWTERGLNPRTPTEWAALPPDPTSILPSRRLATAVLMHKENRDWLCVSLLIYHLPRFFASL